MDCYWYRRPGGIIYQWASSRLFIPRGDNLFPLCIKWASRAFLTESRLLRMSSSRIRMTPYDWYRRPGGIIYQWVSSRLFIPRGDNLFPLCIKWASRAFLTESRLQRMSSSRIRMTSLIECPTWLKCKETGVGSLSYWWVQDGSAVKYLT